ncbi:CAP domain-containing protein [uncultured Roseobacter sp.]|uniref:CAP domain-containing protein n=1 Tax=uncultured Roseobacter sp. TaxID=114847 RepID=UPI002615B35C|nr:CAP domain-containing protein [uncultured Roseobacter sp.]
MIRFISIVLMLGLVLSACAPSSRVNDGSSDGKIYRIGRGDTAKIQFRMLDSVNALRSASGQGPLALDPQLNAAAATHSRDMSVQNRPWHFGSDGSSPIDRVRRVGYSGSLVGENISETYESELETLAAWMQKPDTRRVILSPDATQMGFAWFQERNGKIWWTMVTGNNRPPAQVSDSFASL